MIRPLRSTVAAAALLSLAVTGCRTASPAGGATVEPAAGSGSSSAPSISVPKTRTGGAEAAAPASEPVAAPEEAAAAAAEAPAETERPGGKLLDYYREDSRGNIRALESSLKPLAMPPGGRNDGTKSPIE
ncbi:MAG: hypothetical protein AAGB93_19750 [Planctomycetota bacterium]